MLLFYVSGFGGVFLAAEYSIGRPAELFRVIGQITYPKLVAG